MRSSLATKQRRRTTHRLATSVVVATLAIGVTGPMTAHAAGDGVARGWDINCYSVHDANNSRWGHYVGFQEPNLLGGGVWTHFQARLWAYTGGMWRSTDSGWYQRYVGLQWWPVTSYGRGTRVTMDFRVWSSRSGYSTWTRAGDAVVQYAKYGPGYDSMGSATTSGYTRPSPDSAGYCRTP